VQLRFDPKFAPQNTPALKNGFITFGCCNNLAKLSPGVVELWSNILLNIKNSKLLIEAPGLHQKEFKKSVMSRFNSHGIDSDRLILVNRIGEMQYLIYNQVDIALDPFPYNGGTTTCDLLWFGIPLVTLIGETEVARLGYSFVNNIGFPEWAASTKDDYLDTAIQLSSDFERLNSIRLGLRGKVESSPLMDGHKFVKNFEIAMRSMWKYYLKNEAQVQI
jgi:predicted O-linked N-acetylglucosamine transferase (SPINDLY family)